MPEIEGGCRCGAVRYRLALQSLPTTYACHCLDCQTWSGSAFSQQALVPESALQATGPVVVYAFTGPSGSTSTQRMCGVCHTRVYNSNTARPNVLVVRAGTLDRSDVLRVVAHIWVKRKQPWLTWAEGAPTWPEAAPASELLEALAMR